MLGPEGRRPVAGHRREEEGLFGPNSMAWRVDREIAVLLGSGSRALLLQVAHPKVAAAVAEHSRFQSDPLGRLRGTLNAIYGFSFADARRVETIVQRINGLHDRVRGMTPDGEPYAAQDPDLLLWVYATLIDSSLLAYESFVQRLHPSEREAYYSEFRRAGHVWGIAPQRFPTSLVALREWMADLITSGEVRVTQQGRQVGRYILEPPVWWLPAPVAFWLRLATLWLLPPTLRSGFGYNWSLRREIAMRGMAASSRYVVPRLPRLVRDLPVARAADSRVRRVAHPGHWR